LKVLLADPPQLFLESKGLTRQVQPLGIGYIGAYLAGDHDVRFLLPDTRAFSGDDPWGELRTAIADEAPDLVGITSVTATYGSARKLASVVKSVDRSIVTVLGGVHASTEPVSSLTGAADIDYVVQGEGERTLHELCAALESGRPIEANAIAGLYWRDHGEVRQAPPRESMPAEALDALPYPLRENLVFDDDIHPAFYQALITLRGCPYRCIYCAVPSSNDRKTRYRSASNVVDEIAHLRERHDVPCLFFHDSVFSLHRERAEAICRGMVERNLRTPFHCQTRTDRVDRELLEVMREAGCEQIFFGIESGDVESLRRIRKKMPLDEIRRSVDLVRELGIRCTGFFMVGFPWETEAQMERTADFATDLGLDAISLFSATPLPGTELWELAGGGHMPDSVDFRAPQVNVTSLSDARYGRLFQRLKERVDAYNQSQMYAKLAKAGWLD